MRLGFEREEEEELSLPLPEGVLEQNIRVPLVICVNKCDLQSQVLREESTSKILLILYHLRSLCVKCTLPSTQTEAPWSIPPSATTAT